MTLTLPLTGAQTPAPKPPTAVRAAFAKRFPQAQAVRWEAEGAAWEAGFRSGRQAQSAVFAADGQFRELEREVALATLPPPVPVYLARHYPGQKVQEAARIEDAAGKVTWEAEVGGKDVLFDAAGVFLREAAGGAD